MVAAVAIAALLYVPGALAIRTVGGTAEPAPAPTAALATDPPHPAAVTPPRIGSGGGSEAITLLAAVMLAAAALLGAAVRVPRETLPPSLGRTIAEHRLELVVCSVAIAAAFVATVLIYFFAS